MNFTKHASAAWCLIIVAALGMVQPVAAAEDKKASREKEQIRRLQQAQKQLEDEKSKLQLEKNQFENLFKESSEKLAKAEKDAVAANLRNAALSKELRSAKADLDATRQALDETTRREKDTSGRLVASEGENRKLQTALKSSQEDAAVCEMKNSALYLRGRELLAKIEGQDAVDRLLAKEPLFGIKRVEIENTVQEYRDKVDAERFQRKVSPVK